MAEKKKYIWDELNEAEAQRALATWEAKNPEGLATSLGNFFIAWGQLELGVQAFLREVCQSVRADHFLALGGQLDLYQKTRALVALSHVGAPTQDWREVMRDIGGIITGRLREFRNRMAHDFWINDNEEISSIEFRPDIDKKLNLAKFTKEKVRTPQEINHATWQVVSCNLQLKHLRDLYFDENKKTLSPIYKIPRKPF
ncbi:hypothetical protein U2P60_14780 [Brucella sp. H1_1004]|uniref:hypothetical protein n=1 Tax=Brucella sp. H1_1004 TaxID=3110109 RepID=UPI0039B4FDB7